MATTASARRLFQAVGESPASERLAVAQERLYRPLLDWARDSPLHTDALGHSVHPPLTDVVTGCWLSASLLDIFAGRDARGAATLLAAAGLVASVPTALAGAGDWTELEGDDRRIGAVHSLATDVATFLFAGSLIARFRGRHGPGVALGLAGNVVVAGAGLLGGHLALSRGAADRSDLG
ncbi:hypothetical protein [Aeromicrobium duanguangcaii]|uniref:DUF2231 domain-containing protein n=1 Tax=Aeromicrobium duanguangcaii TaxID=2968086 RepID=A0ABY5KLE6_9ACTN|nr:hypothetical protein [Aeromicrobium duanguangcaii]MCD9153029.1 hypothetical protein [Aeromicrobium duanguangcaii]MCL3836975.1 hypothetical protein [Aeromicrobium duanguangcaii]UUI69865.1 hypothetical protein NP095_07170 [Aeromicrobium duanguangcaii]